MKFADLQMMENGEWSYWRMLSEEEVEEEGDGHLADLVPFYNTDSA